MTEPTWNPMSQQFDPQPTLAEFLLARIAEDEAVARAVETQVASGRYYEEADGSEAAIRFDVDYSQGGYTITAARVLAECAAKRRLIDWAFANAEQIDSLVGDSCLEADMRAGRCDDYGARSVEEVLTKLALPYADHPDFREEWRL